MPPRFVSVPPTPTTRVSASTGGIATAADTANPASRFVQSVPKLRFANVLMIASLTKASGGFNFDGYAKGRLVVTVPQGWTVHVDFRNVGPAPHILMVVSWKTSPTSRRGVALRCQSLGASAALYSQPSSKGARRCTSTYTVALFAYLTTKGA